MFRKSLLVRALLLGFFSLVEIQVQAAVKYPTIISWQGSAWLTGRDGKRQALQKKQILQDRALIETSALAEVRVQLDEHREFTVLGHSEVSLPTISFDGGEAPVVFLRHGSIRWKQPLNEKGRYNTALRSDLFEFIAPPGEYTLSMDPAKALATAKVLEGGLNFSAMNAEESVQLKAGQQVSFQGVLEEGEIAYDILLKGKKIPKGRLTAVSPIDSGEIEMREAARKKLKQDQEQQAARDRKKAADAKKAGFICAKPNGKFNQCAWVCVDNPKSEKKRCRVGEGSTTCVRQRCNANGEWAESTVLETEKGLALCRVEPVLGACDY